MGKEEIDKLFEFLFSSDKEIVELYARILFDKYDYDTIEKYAFNYKPCPIIIYKLKGGYHMFSDNNSIGCFEIVYNPISKSIIAKVLV
jgi:hypothetical protein